MKILRNRTVLGVLCIFLSLAICFGLAPLLNQSAAEKVKIVRVTEPVKAGSVLSQKQLKLVEVGGYNLPAEALRKLEEAEGLYATTDLYPGDYLLPDKLSISPAASNEYLYQLDGSKQAISVSLKSFAAGLSAKLLPGDIVTVVAPDYRKQGKTVIPPEVTYVEVVAVTAGSGFDTGDDTETEEKELPETVTLLAAPAQSRVLAELESEGKLHLTLVYRGQREMAQQFLDRQEELLAELEDEAVQYPDFPAIKENADAEFS